MRSNLWTTVTSICERRIPSTGFSPFRPRLSRPLQRVQLGSLDGGDNALCLTLDKSQFLGTCPHNYVPLRLAERNGSQTSSIREVDHTLLKPLHDLRQGSALHHQGIVRGRVIHNDPFFSAHAKPQRRLQPDIYEFVCRTHPFSFIPYFLHAAGDEATETYPRCKFLG